MINWTECGWRVSIHGVNFTCDTYKDAFFWIKYPEIDAEFAWDFILNV